MRAVWWKSYFLPAPTEFKRAPYTRPATVVPFATIQAAELVGATKQGNAIVNWGGQAMMLHLTSVDDDVAEALKTWANGGSFDELSRHLARFRAHHDAAQRGAASSQDRQSFVRREERSVDAAPKPAPTVRAGAGSRNVGSTVRKSDGVTHSTSPSSGTASSSSRRLSLTVYVGKQRVKVLPSDQYAKYKCAPGETKKLEIV